MKGWTKHIILATWKLRSLALIAYVIQLALALIIGLQVFQVLDASFGDSLAKWRLMEGFDRTVFEDIIYHHGGSLSPLIGIMRWLLLLYLPIYWIMQGGWIDAIFTGNNSIANFFARGITHFKKIAGISLLTVVMMTIWTLVFMGSLLAIIGDPMEGLLSEKPWMIKLLIGLVLWIAGLIAIWVPMFIAKGMYIKHTYPLLSTVKKAWEKAYRNRSRLFLWAILIIFIQVVIIWLGHNLTNYRGASSWFMVVSVIVGQQFTILCRLLFKICFYYGILNIAKLKT